MDYDVYGRLVLTTYPDGSTEARTYTNEGLLDTVTAPSGRVNRTTTYTLNELDQRTAILYHNGTQTQERFDLMDTRTHSIDQQDRRTRYHYDDLGRLTGERE